MYLLILAGTWDSGRTNKGSVRLTRYTEGILVSRVDESRSELVQLEIDHSNLWWSSAVFVVEPRAISACKGTFDDNLIMNNFCRGRVQYMQMQGASIAPLPQAPSNLSRPPIYH